MLRATACASLESQPFKGVILKLVVLLGNADKIGSYSCSVYFILFLIDAYT